MIVDMKESAPYIQFETRNIEDRDTSIREGRYIVKSVNYVIITSPGSKDTVERAADEWMDDISRRASMNPPRFNIKYAQAFHDMYERWKLGQEIPKIGTPIKGWPVISPAEQENIISANVRTVEDLSILNESGLQRIGMGARNLQNKAKKWLESANDHGKVVSEIAAMQVKMEEQNRQIQQLLEKNQLLMDRLNTQNGVAVPEKKMEEPPRQKRAYNRKPKPEPQPEAT